MTSTRFNVGMSTDRASSKATSSSSDSESDEDYVPSSKELRDETNEDDAASDDDQDSAADSDEASGSAGGVKRRKQKSGRKKKKSKLIDEPDQAEGSDEDEQLPKNEPSKNIDDIWKAFKQDVESERVKKQKTDPVDEKTSQPESEKSEPKTKKVTELFEFAGEAVAVEKEVPIDAPEPETKPQPPKNIPSTSAPGPRRGGGGLSSILGQIGKKNKLSILEKSKLDWTSFKKQEGIDEQLQIHNKGKDGFLEKQDFLQRTDLRQFEIEKAMRSSSRRSK